MIYTCNNLGMSDKNLN